MTPLKLTLHKVAIWLARLIAAPEVLARVYLDPMLFASWYALGAELLDWPQEALKLQEAQRNKKLPLERALKLIEQMSQGQLSTSSNLTDARAIIEGYAMHDWVARNWSQFYAMAKAKAEELGPDVELRLDQVSNPLTNRVSELSAVLQLKRTEAKVVMLAFTCAVLPLFKDLLFQITKGRKTNASNLWCTVLACTESELKETLAASGVLRKSRILRSVGTENQLPTLSEFWIDVLSNPLEGLFDSLLKPLGLQPGAAIPAQMAPEDMELAVSILKHSTNSNETGVNLLMYGANALDKRMLLDAMFQSAQKEGFVLVEHERVYGESPSMVYVAQRVLHSRYGTNAVLVVERPADILERKPTEFLRNFLGIDVDSSYIAPFDQLILETNPAPVIWAGPGSDQLQEECIARFVFHAPLKKASRENRRALLERYVCSIKLSKATQSELLALEDVSILQITSAMRAARLSGAVGKREKDMAMVRAVKRSLAVLERETTAKAKECVTEYSLEYINHAGRFGPQIILKAFKLRPKGSLCLYGPPGTGKTQFVEHLAQQLGQRLIIRRASDLLSKWVGENEKNIATMFQEAEAEEAILFLDEGDSFLRDRTLATQSWEVTKVNELLQGMERFQGIFIVATNLFRGLDTAALRRFTFKMEMRALNPEQRWAMFISEAGIRKTLGEFDKSQKDSWKADLYQMHQLAAGDFATVKRQSILLGENLTPQQWIEQLQIECDIKLESQAKQETDETASDTQAKPPPKLVH